MMKMINLFQFSQEGGQVKEKYQDWLSFNLNCFSHPEFRNSWKILFAFILWWTWRWRCSSVFEGKDQQFHAKINFLMSTFQQTLTAFLPDQSDSNFQPIRGEIQVHWKSPNQNSFKLNTDGCSKGNPGPAGGGGVIRNHEGKRVSGFAINIGTCSAIQAELWAIYKGLELAWNLGITHLEIETGSSLAVQWLNKRTGNSSICNNLILMCVNFLSRNWNTSVSHVYRESNRVADKLANLAIELPKGLHIFQQCPPCASHDIRHDEMGVSWPREIVLE